MKPNAFLKIILLSAAAVVAAGFLYPGAVANAALPADLAAVYARRADLRQAFAADGSVLDARRTGTLRDLADWARRYGYKECPVELAAYAPRAASVGEVLANLAPAKATRYIYDFDLVTADKVLVLDAASRAVLLERDADDSHPLASLSKLMTALVVTDRGVPMDKRVAISASDEVGGARLRVTSGSVLTVRQLFDATLVGSANNTACALARSTGLTVEEFVAEMNARAEKMGLAHTTFADPSGIEVANTSTASEIAKLALAAFGQPDVKRATTTSRVAMTVAGAAHAFNNTNGLLTDPYNGLYVTGGKTGYLEESKWNLVVRMHDYRHPELLVIILGSDSQKASFNDAANVARWVWRNYEWPRS